MNQVRIEYVENLHPVFTIPKRIKIIVGGRGSTKSTGVADYVAAKVSNGELWCCARENQNSIEESVHRNILDEIDRLGMLGFEDTKTSISHKSSGGRTFYRGLSRNISSLKSTLSGIDGLWIEEGEDISDATLRILTASVRLNARESEKLIAGEDIKMPEIIITMNRGERSGAIAKKWLTRAETELGRCGYYEDDLLMVVEMNYTDMPQEWFIASGLEEERLDDYDKLSRAEYDHKWLGHYMDAVEGSIIKGEWFDACVDAHKIPHLVNVFKPVGAKKASHDPADGGRDNKGFAAMHGSIVTHVEEKLDGEIDEGCNWAIDRALQLGSNLFVWDGDGMGAGLKGQIKTAFNGTHVDYQMFRGSLSGTGQDNAQDILIEDGANDQNPKTYAETYRNNRAQYYVGELARRVYNTYKCVERGEYIDPDDMISFDSDGIENMVKFKSEMCRIPRKPNGQNLIQVMSKEDMKRLGIESPGMADSVMMLMGKTIAVIKQMKPIKFDSIF